MIFRLVVMGQSTDSIVPGASSRDMTALLMEVKRLDKLLCCPNAGYDVGAVYHTSVAVIFYDVRDIFF